MPYWLLVVLVLVLVAVVIMLARSLVIKDADLRRTRRESYLTDDILHDRERYCRELESKVKDNWRVFDEYDSDIVALTQAMDALEQLVVLALGASVEFTGKQILAMRDSADPVMRASLERVLAGYKGLYPATAKRNGIT